MAKNIEGICRLCGKKKPLTFEHVPPNSAFNSSPAKVYPPDETIAMMTGADGRMPWDFSGLHYNTEQRGGGGYYLCRECNNNTGTWYISEYVKLAKTFHNVIVENSLHTGNYCSFRLYDLYPLRIIKAIMTMYCDINDDCMGDEQLRDFLINKNSVSFNADKYKIYIYMASPSMWRINSLSYIYFSEFGGVMVSEIGCYPIGTILCINKPTAFTPPGLLLNCFAEYGIDEKCTLDICGIPYLDINTLFPMDFRTKEQFQQ